MGGSIRKMTWLAHPISRGLIQGDCGGIELPKLPICRMAIDGEVELRCDTLPRMTSIEPTPDAGSPRCPLRHNVARFFAAIASLMRRPPYCAEGEHGCHIFLALLCENGPRLIVGQLHYATVSLSSLGQSTTDHACGCGCCGCGICRRHGWLDYRPPNIERRLRAQAAGSLQSCHSRWPAEDGLSLLSQYRL